MTYQHKKLAKGKWKEMPLCTQMANSGSEINRALNWQGKGNKEYSQRAVERALELLDLSLDSVETYPKLKEFARLREAIVDYFYGLNQFCSSDKLWRNYFDHFNYASRRSC